MITLLIVDDNRDTRETLARLVDATSKGLETKVIFAATLAEAREMTASCKPNLTFLDLHLPDASMDEVVASIAAFEPPVIVVSGMPPDTKRDGQKINLFTECIVAGAEDFIEKGSSRFLQIQLEWIRVIHKKHAQTLCQS